MPEADARRWFAPTAVLGVVATGLAALAGGRAWAAPDGSPGTTVMDGSGGHVPLAAALALAALACWGVLLVTRGVLRRAVTWLGAVAAVALVATTVVGRASALTSARSSTVDLGLTPSGAHTTAWWYVALVAAVAALLAAFWAVRHGRGWPEMGSRYDAPGAEAARSDPAQLEDIDLWRAIDQGRDPTDPGHA